MKNVIPLNKDWWKEERIPSERLLIKVPPRKQFLDDKNYTVKEIADHLGVGVSAIYDYIHDGLEVQPLRKHYRILGAAMNEYLMGLWKRRVS